jgi:putative ATPase
LPRQIFYRPLERGFEREIKKRLEYWEKLRRRKSGEGADPTPPTDPSAD